MIEMQVEKLDYVETDYNELNNKPIINGLIIEGVKLPEDYGLQPLDKNYVHTDNNYTDEEKSKLGLLENYDDAEIKRNIDEVRSQMKTKTSELINDSNFVELTEENQQKLISLLNSLNMKDNNEIEFVGIVSASGFNDYD